MRSPLDAVLQAAAEGTNDTSAAIQLIELRRMLETGAGGLAAGRISDAAIQAHAIRYHQKSWMQ